MGQSGKTLLVFGIGKLGGAVIDNLATRYPQHKYIMVSRSLERAVLRANLSRYVCSQWGRYPDIKPAASDLLNVGQTAELLVQHKPDVVFNATTPFAWWMMDALPAPMKDLSYKAGLGMWCALDCILPMRLGEALYAAKSAAIYVNGCYPDMTNAFLRAEPAPPVTGIGNMSNLIPGLTLTFARHLNVHPRDLTVSLICHHFTSLNAPTLGDSGGAPYYLSVAHADGEVVYRSGDDTPFALLKRHFSRVRGTEGQGVTVGSAATVLATLLNSQPRRHHAPGPEGLVGGYPIEIGPDGDVKVSLPSGISRAEAIEINTTAQRFDGLAQVELGQVSLTDATNDALGAIVGMRLPTVTPANVFFLAREIVDRLNARYELGLYL